MKSLNFAFIGTGDIALHHADVICALGHTISVAISTNKTKKLDAFCDKYSVKYKFNKMEDVTSFTNEFDAIIVCTPWYITDNIIDFILLLNKPTLVEKPMVLSFEKLDHLSKKYGLRNVLVGFNRRYYDFIPELKKLIDASKVICIDVLSSEPFEMMNKNNDLISNMLFFYSIHMIDLVFYLFGDVDIKSIDTVVSNSKKNYIITLFSEQYNCPIHLKILLDVPQNSFIKVYTENDIYQLLPLEKMSIVDKIEKKVIDGVSSYVPHKKLSVQTSSVNKPGLLEQMKFFIDKYVYNVNLSDKEIDTLYKVTKFCETLKNNKE